MDDFLFINDEPEAIKSIPFPLETLQEDVANVYLELDKIRKRLEVAKRNNATSKSPARTAHMKKMQYKINTCMAILRDFSKDVDALGF